MKFILAGASGLIGGEVLNQCLQNPSIPSLILLSRRELPEIVARDQRIHIVVLEDFLSYPESVTQQFEGTKACLWSVPYYFDVGEETAR
jgi:hypothetical protein